MSEWWERMLGSISARHYAQSTLFLWSSSNYERDHRCEKRVHDAVRALYLGLLMQGVPTMSSILFTAGKGMSLPPEIDSVSYWNVPRRGPRDFGVRVTEETLRQAAAVAEGLAWLYPGEAFDYLEKPIPLRRGFHAWRRAFDEPDTGSRLHQFVRSIEALVQPRALRGASQFAHRCQTFAGPPPKRRETLTMLYRLRSANEHMRDLLPVLGDVGDPDKVLALRCLEAETLASGVYARVLTDRVVLQHFVSDSAIHQFWRKSDGERRQAWGPTVPFEARARRRLIDPL
jgi:hypothetical protein